jgi:hypothetical protein
VEHLFKLAVAGHVSCSGLGLEPVHASSAAFDLKATLPIGRSSSMGISLKNTQYTQIARFVEAVRNEGRHATVQTPGHVKEMRKDSTFLKMQTLSCGASESRSEVLHCAIEEDTCSKSTNRDKRPRITYQVSKVKQTMRIF